MTSNEMLFWMYIASLNWMTGKTKHQQTYKSFLRAASLRIEPEKAFQAVVDRIQAAGGVLNLAQIHRQLQRAYQYVGGTTCSGVTPRSHSKYKKRLTSVFCPGTLKRIASQAGLDDPESFIRSRSVVQPKAVTADDFLKLLYRPGEKVVVFTKYKSQGEVVVEIDHSAAESLPNKGADGVWFLTNPVDGAYHPNPRQNNELSRRSAESITAWRYLLLESDEADERDWMAALVQMPLPIVAICTSGGRSIHALVRINARDQDDWNAKKDMIKQAVLTLGACKGSLSAVRLSRLPQCLRGENLQELLYINPLADGTPILAQRPSNTAANRSDLGLQDGGNVS